MKKLLSALVLALVLTGCAAKPAPAEPETTPTAAPVEEQIEISILGPSGAPSLPLIPAFKDGMDVTIVEGPDVLQAAFVNPEPQYDVIVAPSNLGAKLAAAGKSTYKMEAVLTWGNLYLVAASEEALQNPVQFAAFGEQAVPGMVLSRILEEKGMNPEITWYPSVAEVQGALLSGQADVALMAEPAATATLAKAKEKDLNFSVVMDLQKEWAVLTETEGYPQAALFVRDDLDEQKEEAVERMIENMEAYIEKVQNDPALIEEDINAITPEVLGVPNGKIISKVWTRMNVRVEDAEDVEDELEAFLKMFGIEDLSDIIND